MIKKSGDKTFHMVIATVLSIITLVHVLRLSYAVPVTIGSWVAPMWLSWLVVFVAGYLAVLSWKSAK